MRENRGVGADDSGIVVSILDTSRTRHHTQHKLKLTEYSHVGWVDSAFFFGNIPIHAINGTLFGSIVCVNVANNAVMPLFASLLLQRHPSSAEIFVEFVAPPVECRYDEIFRTKTNDHVDVITKSYR